MIMLTFKISKLMSQTYQQHGKEGLMELILRRSLKQSLRPHLLQKLRLKIRKTIITPEAICPECGYELLEEDIQEGWRDDPLDLTTECPKCGHRFNAFLNTKHLETGERNNYYYLCQPQLFYALKQLLLNSGRKVLGEVFLDKKAPHLLFNMIRHFVSYERGLKAFKMQQT